MLPIPLMGISFVIYSLVALVLVMASGVKFAGRKLRKSRCAAPKASAPRHRHRRRPARRPGGPLFRKA